MKRMLVVSLFLIYINGCGSSNNRESNKPGAGIIQNDTLNTPQSILAPGSAKILARLTNAEEIPRNYTKVELTEITVEGYGPSTQVITHYDTLYAKVHNQYLQKVGLTLQTNQKYHLIINQPLKLVTDHSAAYWSVTSIIHPPKQ